MRVSVLETKTFGSQSHLLRRPRLGYEQFLRPRPLETSLNIRLMLSFLFGDFFHLWTENKNLKHIELSIGLDFGIGVGELLLEGGR